MLLLGTCLGSRTTSRASCRCLNRFLVLRVAVSVLVYACQCAVLMLPLQPWMLCLLALAIGTIAGLVGVGGGEFLVPMFLSFGFQHQKSAATSSCLILLAMLCDAVSYAMSRELEASALH